uniref:Uncharacterized protein n=1 Tax=Brassica oleracea TaxID=3712 RepID=A0A3P6DZV2_BRAOL|nr:unnamed protein product [Brassica oleracea]
MIQSLPFLRKHSGSVTSRSCLVWPIQTLSYQTS